MHGYAIAPRTSVQAAARAGWPCLHPHGVGFAGLPGARPAGTSIPVSMMQPITHVSYLYDMALPSRYSAAIQILNTCRALCELGPTVDVYVRALEGSAAQCLGHYGLDPHPALRLLPLPGAAGRADIRTLHAALKARRAPHVVISRGHPGIRLLPALATGSGQLRERYVYEAHRLCFIDTPAGQQTHDTLLQRITGWLRARRIRDREAATLRSIDGLICLTAGVRAALAAEFGATPPSVILPSGTRTVEEPLPADDARDIDIVYAGKIERRKGVDLLVEALPHLEGRRAWIAGGTAEQVAHLTQHARTLGVGERVVLTGHVAPACVHALYRRARVGVCPLPAGVSRVADEFTSPLKVLEMMAWGVPVVTTDLPSTRELLGNAPAAVLVPPGDARALADGIRHLLEDRAAARKLAETARDRVSAFSWPRRAQKLLAFLQSLP